MKLGVGLLLVVLGASSSRMSDAQCGSVPKNISFAMPGFGEHVSLTSVAYSKAGLQLSGDWQGAEEPLVGLWKVSFVDAEHNFSDTAYITYHSDFTEFQNSERIPSTGAVCQGVWEKTGRSTYRVNHYALGYGDSVNLTNVIRIRESITVANSGKRFTGEFIQDVYDTSHNLLVTFKGSITGKRVTIDSDIDSQ